jgi:tetratricopeptide (TPR) repeat protein
MSNNQEDNNATATDSTDEPSSQAQSANARQTADAQIQAHRQAHQQKIKKVGLSIAVVVIAVIIIIVISQLFNRDKQEDMQTQVIAPVTLSEQEITVFREEFKQALTQYEIRIQPQINKMQLADWNNGEVGGLRLLKEQVLSSFAKGAFADAKTKIALLYTNSENLIKQWQSEVDGYLQTAQMQFEQGNIPQAQLALNKAINLHSDNAEAEALQNRIQAFGEIESLLGDLQVAKVERNLPKQIEVLTDIIDLDPERNALNEDLQEVKTEYDQQQLSQSLEKAQQAIDAGQLSKAEQFIKQAKAIKPSSKGAQTLQTQVNSLRQQQGLGQIKQQVSRAGEQDKWQEVANIVAQSKARYPSDATLLEYQSKAASVLKAKKSLAVFISRPERLADENIRQAAQNMLQESINPSLLSPSLQADIMQVANTIDSYSEPVKVTVQSDGESYILVIGVGHVGEHTEKVIELTPGKYVLEARRDGYRNKRLDIVVEANTPLTVNLQNDDKL